MGRGQGGRKTRGWVPAGNNGRCLHSVVLDSVSIGVCDGLLISASFSVGLLMTDRVKLLIASPAQNRARRKVTERWVRRKAKPLLDPMVIGGGLGVAQGAWSDQFLLRLSWRGMIGKEIMVACEVGLKMRVARWTQSGI